MPRLYGYSKRGARCLGKHDWGAKGRTNVIGALIDGLLWTVALFDESIKAQTFEAWMAQDFLPTLTQKTVIIMDNAAFHRKEPLRKMVHEKGHILLFMPTYSPDLNPIEHK